MGLLKAYYHDEDAAREHLEKLLWPSGPVCPHCGVIEESTQLQPKEGTKTHGRKGLYQCNGCRKQFTVTVGTIFEDSKIPLHKWLLAFHLMCSSKKGVSALQLQRELWGEDENTKKIKGSYRTAWFMCHRIRWVMTQSPMADALTKKLSGVVEVDETYVGGRQRGVHRGRPGYWSNKTPVLALVERGGDVRSFPMERVTIKNVAPILKEHIDETTHVVTDEFSLYRGIGKEFAGHHTIQHKSGQYVRRDKKTKLKVTTNAVESFFALLKRSNYGVHHHMSRKYLASYCAERDFVYNNRKLTDDERTIKALRGSEGRRLMLKHPKNVD